MLEVCELVDFLGNEITPMAEIEKERAMWKDGVDVEKVIADLNDSHAQLGVTQGCGGAGWLNSPIGNELLDGFDKTQTILRSDGLKQQLGGHKGIDTSHWRETWEYELMDGHEWTVTVGMDLGVFLDPGKMIPKIMKAMVDPRHPDFFKWMIAQWRSLVWVLLLNSRPG
ncbi:uncharacterized protein BDZ99DRAFT_520253 [Mytilinidion resinicola]|uniref:Uncharacterized protein n=1 Tax=Mytilinidion resinicola TaxID=574789 RepID=A0A6A6YNQ9_9PEZI|nr:uncharacterized protein BDZ99DRAFT_520253 [Mytilinidion resinicola]KAF2810168.1 hypothetical protein BDZ99DRAFT_520253 [Mytilinidion resinicola]